MAAEPALDYVRSLFVTLRRSMIGTRWQHVRILKALGLKTLHHTVEKPNNSSIRGMLAKVPHMVIVETDRMFYLRQMREYYESLNRDPWVLHHNPAHAAAAQAHQTQQAQDAARRQHEVVEQQRALLQARDSSSEQSRDTQQRPKPRPTWSPPVTPMSMRIAMLNPQPTMAIQGLQPPALEPHLREHLTPLPMGEESRYQPPEYGPPLHELIEKAKKKRYKLLQQAGPHHPLVAKANAEIMELRRQQVEDEETQRRLVMFAKHVPGPHRAKLHVSGKGSRRGLLAEARRKAWDASQQQEQAQLDTQQQQQQQQRAVQR